MTPESAVTFFIAIFIFGITPGPGNFAILARAMVYGARRCNFLILGMVVSDVVYLIMACFGLASIAEHWPDLFTVIRLAGAAYLLYLGYKLFTASAEARLDTKDNRSSRTDALTSFVQGFLISAANPKVILFYIAFLPSFMDLTVLTSRDIVIASGLSFVALITGLTLIAWSAARASRLLRTPKAVRRMNQTAGSIMIGAGIYLAAKR